VGEVHPAGRAGGEEAARGNATTLALKSLDLVRRLKPRREQRPDGDSGFDRMINGLRKKDRRLNERCADMLIRTHKELGANIVHPLVNEAALPGKQPNHRVRLLDVVQRIGESLDPDDFFTVMLLANHQVEKVAKKAVELIAELRPSSRGYGLRASPQEEMQTHKP
jgi:hypothetical protein